jgi:predicted amidophosphoribosyltransferase
MQPIEIVLFAVVAVLALALIGTVVRPYLRGRQPARAPAAGSVAVATGLPQTAAGPPMVCPACHRDFAPGLQFCPHDARNLIPAGDPAARQGSPGATCPTCKRSFDAGKRFCSFDGEELVPLTVALGGAEVAAHLAGVLGKICPNCSRRYESESTFCGRDGEELVVVN